MNRADRLELKAKRAVLRRGNPKQPAVMTEIPREQWPPTDGRGAPVRAWRSRSYLAQLYQEPGKPLRLSVCRAAIADDGRLAVPRARANHGQIQEIAGMKIKLFTRDGAFVHEATIAVDVDRPAPEVITLGDRVFVRNDVYAISDEARGYVEGQAVSVRS